MVEWRSAPGAMGERDVALARFASLEMATGQFWAGLIRLKDGRPPPPRVLKRPGGYRAAEVVIDPGSDLRLFVHYRRHDNDLIALTFVAVSDSDPHCNSPDEAWDLARARAEGRGL